MLVKAVFYRAQTLGEFPINVKGPGDLRTGAREAFEVFRAQFPEVSLFDDNVRVSFEKLEENADGT